MEHWKTVTVASGAKKTPFKMETKSDSDGIIIIFSAGEVTAQGHGFGEPPK